MKQFVTARRGFALLAMAMTALATGCAAVPTGSSEIAANSCRPGSFAALMSAKVDPEQRPGSASLYKDCP